MTNNTKLFFIVLFSLAAIGLVKILQTNPTTLFISIAFTVGIIYLLTRFMKPKRPTDKGYQKALKSQKKKGKMTSNEMQKLTRLKKPTRDVPFKVIEGNKKGKSSKENQNRSNFH
ncbi:SA1362 family protein [Ammoniphilus sp. YIM 78166]|uniref:SA1362 family protein n=1 Tax=Ammoniphilus sp. YIM 78166 TaxID=1644106 RepID=UPI00106F9EA6|nr:SA1362 family protein [Ammoniphilus sp. YIM 78166]